MGLAFLTKEELLERLEGSPDEAALRFIDEWYSPDPHIVAHTSGSTGAPKEIRLAKADMIASAKATCRHFGIDGHSRLGCPLSCTYIAGKMMVVRAIVSRSSLHIEPPSNRPFTMRTPVGEMSLVAVVPSQLESLIGSMRYGRISVRDILVGGAGLTASAVETLAGIDAWESYGMTETCSHVALRRVGDELFTALPGVTFGADRRGCLIIDMEGREAGHIVTNDVVRLSGSRCFRLLGRIDNVINSGGVKVTAEEIERLIAPVMRGEYYVRATQHPRWGEAPELVTTDAAADIGKINALLEGPRRIHRLTLVGRIPKTDSGKVIRR